MEAINPEPYARGGTASTALTPEAQALLRELLEALHGPDYRPVHGIPHRWPVQHADLAEAARALLEEGLLEQAADPHSAGAVPAYRITAEGVRVLRTLRA